MRGVVALVAPLLVLSGCSLIVDQARMYVVPDEILTCAGVERLACACEAVSVLDRLRALATSEVRTIRIGPDTPSRSATTRGVPWVMRPALSWRHLHPLTTGAPRAPLTPPVPFRERSHRRGTA